VPLNPGIGIFVNIENMRKQYILAGFAKSKMSRRPPFRTRVRNDHFGNPSLLAERCDNNIVGAAPPQLGPYCYTILVWCIIGPLWLHSPSREKLRIA
jgi:hypothetical protein